MGFSLRENVIYRIGSKLQLNRHSTTQPAKVDGKHGTLIKPCDSVFMVVHIKVFQFYVINLLVNPIKKVLFVAKNKLGPSWD